MLQKQLVVAFSGGKQNQRYRVLSEMHWIYLDEYEISSFEYFPGSWIVSILYLADDEPSKMEDMKLGSDECTKYLVDLCIGVRQERLQFVQLLIDVFQAERIRLYLHRSICVGDMLGWVSLAKDYLVAAGCSGIEPQSREELATKTEVARALVVNEWDWMFNLDSFNATCQEVIDALWPMDKKGVFCVHYRLPF